MADTENRQPQATVVADHKKAVHAGKTASNAKKAELLDQ